MTIQFLNQGFMALIRERTALLKHSITYSLNTTSKHFDNLDDLFELMDGDESVDEIEIYKDGEIVGSLHVMGMSDDPDEWIYDYTWNVKIAALIDDGSLMTAEVPKHVKHVAYDGGHKFYLIESKDERKMFAEYGYSIFPIESLREKYDAAGVLRFINFADLDKPGLVPQGFTWC